MAQIEYRRAASVASLMQIKDVTEDDAKEIRRIWKTTSNKRAAREAIDKILRTHGVEHLGINRRTGDHVYYANAGDTYATTCIFQGDTLSVSCWGQFIESGTVKEYDPNNQY